MDIFESELKVVEGALTIASTAMGRESNARQRFINMWLDTDEAKEIGQDPSMRYDFAGMAGLTAREFVDWSRRVDGVDYLLVSEPRLQEIKDRLLQIKKEFSYSGVKELQAENAALREKSDKVLDWGEVIDNAELRKKAQLLDEIIEKLAAQEIELAGWDDENNTILYCSAIFSFTVEDNDGVVLTSRNFTEALKSFFERVKE